MEAANLTELPPYLAGLMILWKILTHGEKRIEEKRDKRNGSSGDFKVPKEFQFAATIKGLHETMGLMVESQTKVLAGQTEIVAAVKESGRNMVEAVASHNDNTERMSREINKVTRESSEGKP